MSRKTSASSARAKHRAKNAKHIPDHKIDFSDIPESTETELASARRVGRPSTGQAKQLIAFRIDPALLGKLRDLALERGRPYQTFLHEILERSLKDETRRRPSSNPRTRLRDEVKRFEMELIRTALEKTLGNQTRAARLLGIKTTTLNGKIKRYNIPLTGYEGQPSGDAQDSVQVLEFLRTA